MIQERLKNLGRHFQLLLSTSSGIVGILLVALWVASLTAEGLDSIGPLILVAAAAAFVVSSQRIRLAQQVAAFQNLKRLYDSQLAERAVVESERVRLNAQVTELRRPKVEADAQVLLRMHYRELARRGSTLPPFSDVEFRCRSQNGEDGILLYAFSLIGTTTKRVVEIGAGDGLECNAANLIINHGWQGLLIDGDPGSVARGRASYSTLADTWVAPPMFKHAWVTMENVDSVVSSQGFDGPIDLLSLDIDGNDYWIWKGLTCICPRVVVLEFNASCGPDESLAMSYRADYRLDLTQGPYRCGASLPAFAKLAKTKGYRLVGIQSLGFNAFFVRDGVGEELLPEKTSRECFEQNERLKAWQPDWLEAILSGAEPWTEV